MHHLVFAASGARGVLDESCIFWVGFSIGQVWANWPGHSLSVQELLSAIIKCAGNSLQPRSLLVPAELWGHPAQGKPWKAFWVALSHAGDLLPSPGRVLLFGVLRLSSCAIPVAGLVASQYHTGMRIMLQGCRLGWEETPILLPVRLYPQIFYSNLIFYFYCYFFLTKMESERKPQGSISPKLSLPVEEGGQRDGSSNTANLDTQRCCPGPSEVSQHPQL